MRSWVAEKIAKMEDKCIVGKICRVGIVAEVPTKRE